MGVLGCSVVCRANAILSIHVEWRVCVLMGTFLCERIKMRHKRCNARSYCCNSSARFSAAVKTRRITLALSLRLPIKVTHNTSANSFANKLCIVIVTTFQECGNALNQWHYKYLDSIYSRLLGIEVSAS